jgi:hypothetical protein
MFLPLIGLSSLVYGLLALAGTGGMDGIAGTGLRNASG